jgi:hypothetical protein
MRPACSAPSSGTYGPRTAPTTRSRATREHPPGRGVPGRPRPDPAGRPPGRPGGVPRRPPPASGARDCGHRFAQPDDPGRKRRFYSDACKQATHRQRRREREQAVSEPRTTPAAAPAKSRPAGLVTAVAGPRRPMPAAAAPAPTAARAATTAVPTPSTTIRSPTTAPGAATTASAPRPPRPTSPRKPTLAGPRPSSSAPSMACR